MNFNCICVVLLLGVTYSFAASMNIGGGGIMQTTSSANNNFIVEFLKELLKEDCNEEKNVTDVLSATAKCLEQYIPTSTYDLNNNINLNALSQICSDAKEVIKIINCFDEFNSLLQECSEPEEENLKEFVMKAVEEAIDKICNETSGGEPFYLVLYTPEALQCFANLSWNSIGDCNQQQLFNSHTTVTKSVLCGSLDQRDNCYSNYLSQHCPAAHNLKKVFTETVKSLKSPCVVSVPLTPPIKVIHKPIPVVRLTQSYSSDLYNPIYDKPIIQNPFPIFSEPSNTFAAESGLALLPAIAAIPLPLFIG